MKKKLIICLVMLSFPIILISQGIPQLLTQNVQMEDSIHLATDIYLPSSEGVFPTILYLLPYDRRTQERQQFCQYLVSRGFAVVIQNPRGKFGSEGTYLPFIDELKDFQQTLDWALSQSWCNGDIGIYGSSSSSYNAQLLASTQHPSIKAIVNHSGLTKIDELFFPGGAFRLNTMMPWLNYFYLGKRVPWDQWDAIFKKAPLSDEMEWKTYLLYQMSQQSVKAHKIRTPVLHITGWNDVVYRQTFFLYQDIQKFNAFVPQQLVIGPWEHNYDHSTTQFGEVDFGNESVLSASSFQRRVADWFDRYVKNIDIPETGKHELFIMGMNQWIDIPDYPPAESQPHKFYLQKDHQMGAEQPENEQAYGFIFDPENPVPTFGGVNSHLFPKESGPRDQSRFLDREDIIAFESDTLDEDMYVLGKLKMILFASSDAQDTDFTAKLMVKTPDSTYRIIEDGIIRAANRNTFRSKEWLEKEEIYEMVIDLGFTGIEVKAGEQLVLHISSSNFPKYNVNHNVKENPLETGTFKKANQTIYAGGRNASYLLIDTVPKAYIQQYLRPKGLNINNN